MRLWIAGIVGLLLVGGMALAQGVAPIGGQFQVNALTPGNQFHAEVAKDARGDFVVVWDGSVSSGTDTSGVSIQARRFEANGTPKELDFQVNTYTWQAQDRPNLAVGPQGDFVVVWDSTYSDGDDTSLSIQGQRFDNSGTPVGAQFEVNSFTTGQQSLPRASLDPQGQLVVVWYSLGSYGNDDWHFSVQGQRYDDTGTPDGGQFQVNTFTNHYQITASVGAASDGDFVVVWMSQGSSGADTSNSSIQAQRYEADGTLDGGEFEVNSYTTSHQYRPALAVNGAGDFVVAWESYGSDGTDTSRWSIQGQRFDATGALVDGQFQVNSYTTEDQYKPAVGMGVDGSFIVVWESEGSSGTDDNLTSVQGQFYDASGKPVGGEFQVNSYTYHYQLAPAVSAVDPEGNFVVVWESRYGDGTDTNLWSVQAQRFASRPVLVDNFESGDLSAWSIVVQ